MLNTRDTVVAEKRRCLYLAAARVLHLEEVDKRQQAEQERKGMKRKKRQPNIEQGKPGQCGLGNGWLEDMSSDIMMNYWQNSTRKIPEDTEII